MPTVYRVLPDLDHFQCITTDDIDTIMAYSFDGTVVGDTWRPPLVYSPYSNKSAGDFWGSFGNNAIFSVTKIAATKIVTFLDQSCETLPIVCEGQTLLLCNVVHVINCLDTTCSHHKAGLPHWIEKYVFHPRRFEYSLFKIPETAMSEVLCVEGLVAPEDEFKGTVEMLGLKGLRFQKLWTD